MKKPKLRINNLIVLDSCSDVRLIGDDSSQLGIVELEQALKIASDKGLDLVEISPESIPPVCKIMDYSKYKFNIKKRIKDSKKSIKKNILKEIKLRVKIDDNDYNIKMKKLREFLSKSYKVKISIQFKGRELFYKELGFNILAKVLKELEDLKVVVDKKPKFEGRQIVLIISCK